MEILPLVAKFNNNEAGLGLDLLMQKAKDEGEVLDSHVVTRLTCPFGSVRLAPSIPTRYYTAPSYTIR